MNILKTLLAKEFLFIKRKKISLIFQLVFILIFAWTMPNINKYSLFFPLFLSENLLINSFIFDKDNNMYDFFFTKGFNKFILMLSKLVFPFCLLIIFLFFTYTKIFYYGLNYTCLINIIKDIIMAITIFFISSSFILSIVNAIKAKEKYTFISSGVTLLLFILFSKYIYLLHFAHFILVSLLLVFLTLSFTYKFLSNKEAVINFERIEK